MKLLTLASAVILFNLFAAAQNVGIGTTSPTLAGLVVNKAVGSTYAVFGGNTTGVSMQASWPGIGFNEYYNAGAKFIGTGYGGAMYLNPDEGSLGLSISNAAGAANGGATLNEVFKMSREGVLAIKGSNAAYIFGDRTLTNYDGWAWYADNGKASLYRYTSGGNLLTIAANGNVGIGSTAPSAKLEVRDNSGNYAAFVNQTGAGISLGVQGNTAAAALFAFNTSTGPAITTLGRVGINNSNPSFMLDVEGRMRLRNDGASTPGLWLDGKTSPTIGFIGTFDNTKFGFYGAGIGWGMLFDASNGRLGVGTGEAAPNSKLQVAGSVSMPYKAISDNYAVSDDDYTIQFITGSNTGVVKTIYLPAAAGRTGRIYKISAQIPYSGPAYCSDFTPSAVNVIESGTNVNVIQQNISTQYAALAFYSCIFGVNGNLRRDTKQLSLTVQSNGTAWKVIDHSFWQNDFPN